MSEERWEPDGKNRLVYYVCDLRDLLTARYRMLLTGFVSEYTFPSLPSMPRYLTLPHIQHCTVQDVDV